MQSLKTCFVIPNSQTLGDVRMQVNYVPVHGLASQRAHQVAVQTLHEQLQCQESIVFQAGLLSLPTELTVLYPLLSLWSCPLFPVMPLWSHRNLVFSHKIALQILVLCFIIFPSFLFFRLTTSMWLWEKKNKTKTGNQILLNPNTILHNNMNKTKGSL